MYFMSKSKNTDLQRNAFQDFFTEKIKSYDTVIIAKDKNIYLTGVSAFSKR